MPASTNDMIFFQLLKSEGLPIPTPEFKFANDRKFRFDYCWQTEMVALEVEGGVWKAGRHTRGSGFIKDMEKYNLAACKGYRLIRTVPTELCTMKTIELIKEALQTETPF
jgi:hypothetical protein